MREKRASSEPEDRTKRTGGQKIETGNEKDTSGYALSFGSISCLWITPSCPWGESLTDGWYTDTHMYASCPSCSVLTGRTWPQLDSTTGMKQTHGTGGRSASLFQPGGKISVKVVMRGRGRCCSYNPPLGRDFFVFISEIEYIFSVIDTYTH